MHELDIKNKSILREVDSASDEYFRKIRELSPGSFSHESGFIECSQECSNWKKFSLLMVIKYAKKNQAHFSPLVKAKKLTQPRIVFACQNPANN